jgi:adenylate kinase family enzyme
LRKVAVFGNAGGGKSLLARRLAESTGLPLHVIDIMQFPGGKPIPHEEYLKAHESVLARDSWVIDGFGCVKSAWQRLAMADTLVYIDLPLYRHFLGVSERLLKGFFAPPPGWPEGSPLLKSSLNSYRVLWPCHRDLTPRYRDFVSTVRPGKAVYHLRTRAEMDALAHKFGA